MNASDSTRGVPRGVVRRRASRCAAWCTAFALTGAGLLVASPERSRGLLGPIAGVAAGVEWVRFDAALSRGRTDLAYRRAERALALDPAATGGWSYYASHLVFDRGSASVEEDPARRWAWIRAGLDVLERGERTARAPEELVLYRAIVHRAVAEGGGSPELDAAGHAALADALFADAAARGLDLAAEARESLRHDHDHGHGHDHPHGDGDGHGNDHGHGQDRER